MDKQLDCYGYIKFRQTKKIFTNLTLCVQQRLSELEVYPNERIPKIFALPERIPNELLKKPRIPEQTRPNQFYYLNIHRLSFAPRKHGFSINLAEKLFLEILVLHGGRTGTNQMTSNTKNSFNSGGGCRARVNLHSKFRKQRKSYR